MLPFIQALLAFALFFKFQPSNSAKMHHMSFLPLHSQTVNGTPYAVTPCVISCFRPQTLHKKRNLHFHSDLHQTKQQTPRTKNPKMETKWQKQLIKWSKFIHSFSFRITGINVCPTSIPFNRWNSCQRFLTNGMLNSSHECLRYYKPPRAVLHCRSALTS